ncbi:MAG: hypothetical protein AAFP00_05435, partial [Bacteroidota bacterium]
RDPNLGKVVLYQLSYSRLLLKWAQRKTKLSNCANKSPKKIKKISYEKKIVLAFIAPTQSIALVTI